MWKGKRAKLERKDERHRRAPNLRRVRGANFHSRYMRSRTGSGGRYSDHPCHSEADEVMHAVGSRPGFGTGNNGYARFRGANGSTAYAEDIAIGERRTLQCAATALFCGFVLVVTGLSVMWSADYTSVKLRVVAGYDEIVDRWTDVYAPEFVNTRFDVVVGDVAVTASATHDVTPIDTASGNTHDYFPIAFELGSLLEEIAIPGLRGNETLGLPADGWGDEVLENAKETDGDETREHATPVLTPEQERAVFEYLTTPREVFVRAYSPLATRARNESSDVLTSETPENFVDVSLGARALVTKTEKKSNGWKPCKYQHGGFFRGGMCTTYTVLDTLCVKVSVDRVSGVWGANSTYGGAGCDPRREWEIETRAMTRAPPSGADLTLATIRHLGHGRVVVRSAFDPLIAARNITDGSMFFAETQASQSAGAVVLLVVGCACLVPGVILGIPFASRAWRGREMLRNTRGARRGTGGNTHEEEFDDIV